MQKMISSFAVVCDKLGGRLILLSLLAILIFYFTAPTLILFAMIALSVGLVLFTLGAFIQLTVDNADPNSKSKSIEDLETHASTLAKSWVAEFEAKYG